LVIFCPIGINIVVVVANAEDEVFAELWIAAELDARVEDEPEAADEVWLLVETLVAGSAILVPSEVWVDEEVEISD